MMRQAQVTGPEKPLKVTSVPMHEVPAKGLLIKTAYAGVCHSDLHFIKDKLNIGDGNFVERSKVLTAHGIPFEGFVLGHEISGTVVKFGSEATPDEYGLKEGDRVSIFPWQGCGDCEICENDYSNHCCDPRNGIEGGFKFNWMGSGGLNKGGFQDYVQIRDCRYAVKLPDSITMPVGAMIPCSGATSYSAVTKVKPYVEIALKRRKCARVLVYGGGGLGLWAVGLLKIIYADRPVKVIVADIFQDKLDAARQSGADDVILLSRDDDAKATIKKIRENGKMDAVLDFVGSEATAQVGLGSLNVNGTYVVVGLIGGKISYPIPAMISNALCAQGSVVANLRELKELIELVSKNQVVVPEIDYYALEDCNTALDDLKAGRVKGRALLKFD